MRNFPVPILLNHGYGFLFGGYEFSKPTTFDSHSFFYFLFMVRVNAYVIPIKMKGMRIVLAGMAWIYV